MRFLFLLLLIYSSSFCMQEMSSQNSSEREEEQQALIERESVEEVVARILNIPAERTERDYYLYCGDKKCCDCYQASARCLFPCAYDEENHCKLTGDDRCCFYKWGSSLCCLVTCFCTWGWATQGPPPCTAPH
jgi:hypothetical protein